VIRCQQSLTTTTLVQGKHGALRCLMPLGVPNTRSFMRRQEEDVWGSLEHGLQPSTGQAYGVRQPSFRLILACWSSRWSLKMADLVASCETCRSHTSRT
jgi:hypothetical protein